MIFMQQMQYNAPNRMYVLQNFSGSYIPGPPFAAVTLNRSPFPPKSWLRACHSLDYSSAIPVFLDPSD